MPALRILRRTLCGGARGRIRWNSAYARGKRTRCGAVCGGVWAGLRGVAQGCFWGASVGYGRCRGGVVQECLGELTRAGRYVSAFGAGLRGVARGYWGEIVRDFGKCGGVVWGHLPRFGEKYFFFPQKNGAKFSKPPLFCLTCPLKWYIISQHLDLRKYA